MRADELLVLALADTTSDDHGFERGGPPPSPAMLRVLEVGALLQAAAALLSTAC